MAMGICVVGGGVKRVMVVHEMVLWMSSCRVYYRTNDDDPLSMVLHKDVVLGSHNFSTWDDDVVDKQLPLHHRLYHVLSMMMIV